VEIKDYVKNCTVEFQFYRDNSLWYKVIGGPTELEFPVPIDDIGNATFHRNDKALYFMRYIRKHVEWLDKNRPKVTSIKHKCPLCNDSGVMRYSGSPSGTLMGPCEACEKGEEYASDISRL